MVSSTLLSTCAKLKLGDYKLRNQASFIADSSMQPLRKEASSIANSSICNHDQLIMSDGINLTSILIYLLITTIPKSNVNGGLLENG